MYNEFMLYATGEVVPRRGDRPVAGRAKRIYDDVREADLMARGAFALGADIMDQTAMLFAKGKALSGGDPVLSRLLAEEVVMPSTRHSASRAASTAAGASEVSAHIIVGIASLIGHRARRTVKTSFKIFPGTAPSGHAVPEPGTAST